MGKLKYTGDLLADLILDDWETFHAKHPEINKNTWKGKRNYHRKRLKEGKVPMEQLPQQNSEETVSRVAELLERSGIDPNDIQRVNRVNVYQGYMKGEDGEFVTRDLYSVQYVPKGVDQDYEQTFITQAAPTQIRPSRVAARRSKDQLAVDIPDIQYGWRRLPDGTLVPLHDSNAMDIALQFTKEKQPNLIILGGDDMDMAEFSKYDPDSRHFEDTSQMSIDGLHKYYAQLRADNPNARIVALEGNHNRLTKFVLKHAMKLHGLKRANMPDEWAVLTYPFLMRFDELEIEWVSGYPANEYMINDRLSAIHGKEVRSNGSTAQMYASRRERSVIFHHVHRHEMHTTTTQLGKYVTAASFGCLARIDGAVPSYGNGVDDNGHVVHHQENWQLGFGAIEYRAGDSPFQLRPVQINPNDNYETRIDGKVYKPRDNQW